MREREEEAGARGGPAAVHPALQHRCLHDHGQHQQAGDQEKGTKLNRKPRDTFIGHYQLPICVIN